MFITEIGIIMVQIEPDDIAKISEGIFSIHEGNIVVNGKVIDLISYAIFMSRLSLCVHNTLANQNEALKLAIDLMTRYKNALNSGRHN